MATSRARFTTIWVRFAPFSGVLALTNFRGLHAPKMAKCRAWQDSTCARPYRNVTGANGEQMRSFNSCFVSTVLLVGLTTGLVWAIQGPTLEITVAYMGQDGEVSSDNALYVVVFDTASMMQATPIAQAVITENGGTALFSNLIASPVYVSAFYDTHGSYAIDQPEPPSGSPAGQYVTGGSFAPAPVELPEGEATKIAFQITDLFRMP